MLALSGQPRAAAIITALQAGRLFMGADKALFIKQDDGGLTDAATGAAAPDVMASGLRPVRMNNAVRGAIDAALGSLRLFSPDRTTRLAAAEAVFRSHDPAALPALDRAIAKEADQGVETADGAGAGRRAAVVARCERGRSTGGHHGAGRSRRHRQPQPDRGTDRPAARRRSGSRGGDQRDRFSPAALERGAERLLRPVARLGAAAGRGGACDHLRRHGRDQHGARRDGDDRRLRDLHGAAGDPRQCALAVRRQSADCRAACVHCGRRDRHRHRAHVDPLAIRQAAGDSARDLGICRWCCSRRCARSSAPTTAR